MIQIQSIRIQEFRGIRDLTLDMRGKTFVVSGPNGSGKSGVVDAIQFALTGEIARLQGPGTGDLRLAEHGPHVEQRKHPELSAVQMTVYVPHLRKEATIRRTIAGARQPEVTPDSDDIRAVFAELAKHPEITLARREVIRLILTEATKRSQDVQTLLQLHEIDTIRRALKTTANKLGIELAKANERAHLATDALTRHLEIKAATSASILAAANSRRKTLGLPEIEALTKDTSVSDGMVGAAADQIEKATPGKASALADFAALAEALGGGFERTSGRARSYLVRSLGKVASDSALRGGIRKVGLLEAGVDLVEGPACPLCDAPWDIDLLRTHLLEKLTKAREAGAIAKQIAAAAQAVAKDARRLDSLLDPLVKLPEASEKTLEALVAWRSQVTSFLEAIGTLDGAIGQRNQFDSGWATPPPGVAAALDDLKEMVQARPEKGALSEATAFLAVAQERLSDLRQAKRAVREVTASAERGRTAYKAYCDVSEAVLLTLYREVEGDLSDYYRAINQDDESEFTAEFLPSEGKLGLRVDFYKKGRFPPGAYHSEGHQDGMGVCLYLALLKRVLGDRFTLAVLDDVVMSVDSQHRRRFCRLLKKEFPATQFVITTHDDVWARQMRSEGLVESKATVAFNTWTVETGPVVSEITDVWNQVEGDLARKDLPAAAARLRRHCEYSARELAHSLGARVPFRADGAYEMGPLLDGVISRHGELLKTAAAAARSWAQADELAKVVALQDQRTALLKAFGDERWAVNKLVHYNEWLNLTDGEFRAVVSAVKSLLDQLRCAKPECRSWLFVTSAGDSYDLRCDCGSVRLNLKEK